MFTVESADPTGKDIASRVKTCFHGSRLRVTDAVSGSPDPNLKPAFSGVCMKRKFALLCAIFAIFASLLSAQSTENVSVKVTVVDGALNLKNVPKFVLV